ncbi:serine/threonine protein kinase [Ideonella sp. BN130291]|uniref:serine/threonine protein kinase n=1 Tax=Ideonella sp. BN130291 TaxID=3112940 RepID=UPI002E270DB3|nr:HDOD domain-containing protein [Ideonella sp. BN130291]
MAASPVPPSSKTPAAAVRRLGRFELLKLLGKSVRSMVWLVHDPRAQQELILAIPRNQPADAPALERWMQAVRKAARLNHPHLAHVVEVGEQDRWPFVAYDRANGLTLAEKLSPQGLAATDVARWMAQALDGLAFVHEGGIVHRDVQPHMLLLSDQGNLRVMGLEVALDQVDGGDTPTIARSLSVDPNQLRAQRDAAQRDVLAIGLVMHHLLVGTPALEEADVGRVMERLPPLGPEFVRLPWSMARPVPEPLRAIVNRSTDRQERQRYRTARTFAHALAGWLDAESNQGGGPLALLLDRVRTVGALPALPGGTLRAARLMRMERERTNELADLVLRDLALAFELLRVVNTAKVRGTQVAGNGPVLTVRRAIAMIGLQGVQRAAQTLRPWPGPLDEQGARDLHALIERVKRAGRVAQSLRPAGYDAEVVYLVTLMQSLGRLVVQYHFPDEAAQIRRLMQPAPSAKPGEPDEPGMTEETAAFAVLGADIETLGAAVARQWGMDDEVMHMIRRLPTDKPVRTLEGDGEVLRAVGSLGNEVTDAIGLPAAQVTPALTRIAQRYGRALNLTLKDLQEAVQVAAHMGSGDELVTEEEAAVPDTLPMPMEAPAPDVETLTGDER